MIIKMTNKDELFYHYMGRFFGSRIVQTETKDRIYDDNQKTWYIYLGPNSKPCGFISISNNTIKNIYSNNIENLKALLLEVLHDIPINDSIVTNAYKDVYAECGLEIFPNNLKNFITIRGEKNA